MSNVLNKKSYYLKLFLFFLWATVSFTWVKWFLFEHEPFFQDIWVKLTIGAYFGAGMTYVQGPTFVKQKWQETWMAKKFKKNELIK